MLSNFDDSYSEEIPYLKISDRMTTGMGYVRNDLSNSFQAFVRSSQISVKGDTSGAAGSHGYGKAAYYLLSPARTLLVSTMTEDGLCFFEGASIVGSLSSIIVSWTTYPTLQSRKSLEGVNRGPTST